MERAAIRWLIHLGRRLSDVQLACGVVQRGLEAASMRPWMPRPAWSQHCRPPACASLGRFRAVIPCCGRSAFLNSTLASLSRH